MIENNESNIPENHFVFETDNIKSKKKKYQKEPQNGYSEEGVDNCVVDGNSTKKNKKKNLVENDESNIPENRSVFETDNIISKKYQKEYENGYSEGVDNCVIDGSSTKKKKYKKLVENNESNIPENHFVFETDNIKSKTKKRKNRLGCQALKKGAGTEENSDNVDVTNTISHEKETNSKKEKQRQRKNRDKDESISFHHTKNENECFNNENEVVIKKKIRIKRKRKHEGLLENNTPEKLEPVLKKKKKRSSEIDVYVQEEMSLIDIINKKPDIVIAKKKKKKKKHHSDEEWDIFHAVVFSNALGVIVAINIQGRSVFQKSVLCIGVDWDWFYLKFWTPFSYNSASLILEYCQMSECQRPYLRTFLQVIDWAKYSRKYQIKFVEGSL